MNRRDRHKLILLVLFVGIFTLSFIGSDLQVANSKVISKVERSWFVPLRKKAVGNTVLKKNYQGIKAYKDKQYVWADSILAEMTLEEKVGQLFMIATYSNRNESYYQDVRDKIQKYHLGGLIFFQGTAPVQARLTNEYQTHSKIPLLIGMDAEWGLGMRLDNTVSFPKQITLGAIADNSLIENMGYEIGWQLKRLGVHINFAPVADVNTNPKNPVINFRSFGESQNLVADKAAAYARGLKRAGVMAVAKHFPGHGDTGTDSHVSMPVISQSFEKLSSQELVPFRRLINDSIAGIMTGHLFVPALDNRPNRAATISKKIVTDLLQNQMGFRGLTFTDALNMRGITSQFPPGGADLAAYEAGNDVLLQTADLDAAFNKILSAFEKGELDVTDLDRRVRKILSAKYGAGLNKPQYVNPANLLADLNNSRSNELLDLLYKNAVTVIRSEKNVFPFIQLDTLAIGTVAVSAPIDNEFQIDMSSFGKVVNYQMPIKPGSPSDWQYIVDQAFSFDAMVISVHDMNSRSSQNYGVSPSTIDLIKALSQKTKVIVIAYGNPYGLELFDQFPNLICGFESDPHAYKAVSEILFGAGSSKGHLPVTASSLAKYNFGQSTASVGRLTEDIPENAGMSSQKLDEIEGIVNNAISKNAFPGAQVLVARRGKVVYNKAFGTFRYGNTEKVTTNTLYDLASLTKVSATLQAVMMLNERGLLNLNLKASDYLPELIGTNKEDMIVGDILFHQAGLKSFQAFWTHTKTSGGAFKQEFYPPGNSTENLQVAENLYIHPAIRDSVWKWLIDTDYTTRKTSNGFKYLYSDLGLIMMQRIIEQVTNQPLDEFLDQNLYEPLGMTHTLFNPLSRFPKSQIAPTENDQVFRKGQIWGTVHDPNAALLGGVAGHAGLFSNAWDLAKLYQMNLQNGVYGGRRYLYSETVKHFATNFTTKSHRGIGWNKPVETSAELSSIASTASPSTFGHTGFTGTVVWVDPDRQLIFIMLSNRVYPRANNNRLTDLEVRRKIHEVINEAVDLY